MLWYHERAYGRLFKTHLAWVGQIAIRRSKLTCPHCGTVREEIMPTDACMLFYECTGCRAVLRPKPDDCCVLCSFGSVKELPPLPSLPPVPPPTPKVQVPAEAHLACVGNKPGTEITWEYEKKVSLTGICNERNGKADLKLNRLVVNSSAQ